jgi:hypothetical protein
MMLRGRYTLVLLSLITLGGCARQPRAPADPNGSPAKSENQATLPFGIKPAHNDGITPTASLVPAVNNVPAGTPLVVRLQSSLSSATAHAGDTFRAVLDEPILVDGKQVLPAGTTVIGSIVGHKAASKADSSYLRLTVTSLLIGGESVRVDSSSISDKTASLDQAGRHSSFVNSIAAPPIKPRKNAEFGVQRRLTFRLTAPLALAR